MSTISVAQLQRSHRAEALIGRLEEVRAHLLELEAYVPLDRFGPARESARNLVHYIALRQFDLRTVQDRLADLGLSSLGRAEGHVLFNLDSILDQLYAATGRPPPARVHLKTLTPAEGRRRLARNASQLFGHPFRGRQTRIMVTLPAEAADRPEYLRELVKVGTDCVRINCAHDSEEVWAQMIKHLRAAERELGRRCRVEMDLGGPRLRTGSLEPGPAVLKVRPVRDAYGRAVRPGRLRISANPSPARPGRPVEPEILAPEDWVRRRRLGEAVRMKDSRGARRTFRVVNRTAERVTLAVAKTTYFANGLVLEGRQVRGRRDRAVVDGVLPKPGRIRLRRGDWLRLSRGAAPGRQRSAARTNAAKSAVIGVSVPEVLDRVRRGDRVWFDGGRIGGTVHSWSPGGVLLKVTSAPPEGTSLRGDMGVNFPDTELTLGPLTEQDDKDLRFIARHADLVGYSFVQTAADVELLHSKLADLGRPKMSVVLKIETRRAFDELPAILLAALGSGPTGVMVARGDLAVEVGFDRLAEVQEEILWLAEAAHLPSIWATQVLEGLAKSGMPTRAEVTDAAMGERAECVMLNKGPYLPQAVEALDSIIRRMQAHQAKKSARLRHLRVAERFLSEGPPSLSKPRSMPGN